MSLQAEGSGFGLKAHAMGIATTATPEPDVKAHGWFTWRLRAGFLANARRRRAPAQRSLSRIAAPELVAGRLSPLCAGDRVGPLCTTKFPASCHSRPARRRMTSGATCLMTHQDERQMSVKMPRRASFQRRDIARNAHTAHNAHYPNPQVRPPSRWAPGSQRTPRGASSGKRERRIRGSRHA